MFSSKVYNRIKIVSQILYFHILVSDQAQHNEYLSEASPIPKVFLL